ncbi:uncharacterized protein BO95DRAFT_360018, partial [Aspergillus brunneoviolaceus CBS 621.78]
PLLTHLRTKLHPLVSSTTGQSHPSFPQTLLAFHCLTHAQLDSLARHFHQVYPAVPATEYYPITVPPWVGTEGAAEVDLEVKRRRFGRFIGLRGCESPTLESSGQEGRNAWTPEEMLARMAKEWDAAMERAKWDSNFALRWKMGG